MKRAGGDFIAVGTPVAGRSPHRSQRAVFSHWALQFRSLCTDLPVEFLLSIYRFHNGVEVKPFLITGEAIMMRWRRNTRYHGTTSHDMMLKKYLRDSTINLFCVAHSGQLNGRTLLQGE